MQARHLQNSNYPGHESNMQQLINNIVSAIHSGNHADALLMARELAKTFPNDEGVLSLLAISEQNAGDLATARRILERLVDEHPATWQHWTNLGNVCRLLGELPDAASAYAHALSLNPDSARLRANLGLLHLNLGEYPQARENLCMASTLPGAEPGMRVWAAVACQASGDDATAAALIEGWQQWPAISEEAMLELGWLLMLLGDQVSGERVLSGEFQDSSLRTRALARRIMALERVNKISQAVELMRQVQEPSQIDDRQARMETLQAIAAVATREKNHAAARQALESALSLDQPIRYRRPLLFALARVCDSLGDVDAAMMALNDAHSAEASELIQRDGEQLAGTGLLALAHPMYRLGTSASWPSDDAPALDESPVFLVGFPRSGTTLLEQMLAAHADFESTDEQPMLQRVLERIRERGIQYPNGLGTLSAIDRLGLREMYWHESRKLVTLKPGQRLVDKHPLNFLALPLIRFLFPNAPVLFCRRHPCDSILSSYMQDFRDPRLAAECASLERLANLYVTLDQRWQEDVRQFPQNILVLRHEDLVSKTEVELRRLGDFLGVEDTSSMIRFNEHALARGFIGTPSYAQVVQPINSEASGRWRRYAAHVAPILPTLAPIIDRWGYAD